MQFDKKNVIIGFAVFIVVSMVLYYSKTEKERKKCDILSDIALPGFIIGLIVFLVLSYMNKAVEVEKPVVLMETDFWEQ